DNSLSVLRVDDISDRLAEDLFGLSVSEHLQETPVYIDVQPIPGDRHPVVRTLYRGTVTFLRLFERLLGFFALADIPPYRILDLSSVNRDYGLRHINPEFFAAKSALQP